MMRVRKVELTKPIEEYVPDFRVVLEEFEEDMYPDEAVTLSLRRTRKFIGPLWGEYIPPDAESWARDGWFYRAAHYLMISRQFFDAVKAGDIPSTFRGIDSTMIEDESVTFGSQIMLKLSPWNESLNATQYGLDFLEMRSSVEKKAPTFR